MTQREKWKTAAILVVICGTIAFSCKDNGSNSPVIPEISSISPASGPIGATVTIKGSGFGTTASGNKVTFNGTLAEVASASESSIQTTVPEDAKSGAVAVVVDGQMALGPNFSVESALPGVTALEPDSGHVGTEVTIKGMNFSPTASDNIVTFNGGVISEVRQASETELITEVPEGAESGPITVEVNSSKTLSPSFEVIAGGGLTVTAATSGIDIDTDGYLLRLGNGEIRALNTNGTVTFGGLNSGDYRLELVEMAGNCSVDGMNPRTVTVTEGDTAATAFDVVCSNLSKIAFASDRTGNQEIWVMDADGSNPTNLTVSAGTESSHHWSPDGSQIVFVSDRTGNNEVWVMDADGSNQTNLTNDGSADENPIWSPDGSKIAFESDRTGNAEIWIMNPDGTNQTNLTNDGADDGNPRWSPDGTQIAFRTNRTGDFEIWTMDTDGSNPTNLTNDPGSDLYPRWSPDGSRITFTSTRSGDNEIWTMDADGTNPVNLTDSLGIDQRSRWSPQGTQLVFESYRTGTIEIWLMEENGTNLTNLSRESSSFNQNPRWSPDGFQVTFVSDRTGNNEILVTGVNGLKTVNLTKSFGDDFDPQWRPK